MRRLLALSSLVALAACGRPASEGAAPDPPGPGPERQRDVQARGPDVAPSAEPGTALDYVYDFRLPVSRIARVQETHAAQCEALGPDRCRVVGMGYHADRRAIRASLDLRLAPDIARRFGRQAIAAVTAEGGMLGDAEITATAAGTTVAAVAAETDSVAAEQAQLGRQLARRDLPQGERVQLQARLAELRDRTRRIAAAGSEATRLLARTPMHLNYGSGDYDPGFDDGPLVGALKDGWANIVAGCAVLLMLAVSVLPWLAALVAVVWLVRRFGPALGLRRREGDPL